jgi:hypothetical protein
LHRVLRLPLEFVRVRQRQQLADERRLLAAGSAQREQSPELF